jgi:hypothetical protein
MAHNGIGKISDETHTALPQHRDNEISSAWNCIDVNKTESMIYQKIKFQTFPIYKKNKQLAKHKEETRVFWL